MRRASPARKDVSNEGSGEAEGGTRSHAIAVDAEALGRLLNDVAAGTVAPDDAMAQLRRLPFADLGYARIDHHRGLRQGLPEAVYGPGKSPEHVAGIVGELLTNGTGPVLVTRVSAEQTKAALGAHPLGVAEGNVLLWRPNEPTRTERVVIAAAGTADLPVADECATVLRAYGFNPTRLTDVGVAGLHRLLPHIDTIAAADAVVAVAGMEGALASVVGGLTAAPVVAVPTSVGYGAGLEGVTALLSMLASCASGITVVGIDNGFGAACAVARLLNGLRNS
jgi:pyridinium-3,5-biscarboxylic acid mononucleotide synthase